MIPSSHLSKVYHKTGWGNLTDLYQLTMAYGYWKKEIHEQQATFHLFFRQHPFKGNYTIAAGLALVADFLQHFSYSTADVQYLGSLKGADGKPLFSESFLHYLQRLKFTGTLFAMPEGTIAYPHEPLLRIEAPLLQAQLIETALLTLVNFSSLIATKSARIRQAAGDDVVLEFGLRRAQGIDGGLTASRSAYLGGCDATSNVWAGQHLGIPVRGTQSHSWIMVFPDEIAAFNAYAEALPNNCTFLIDTYDTLEGVKNAIEIGKSLREKGHRLLGVRLDSGDLLALSKKARVILDEAGFSDAAIVASNNLDEHRVRDLKIAGANITTWGIGTRLTTAYDQPALGGVYKLAALQEEDGSWKARLKQSVEEIKVSNPGRQQVRRFTDEKNSPLGDMVYNVDSPPSNEQKIAPYHLAGEQQFSEEALYQDLLVPVFMDGELVYDFPSLVEMRTYCLQQVNAFERRGDKPYIYGLEVKLAALKKQLRDGTK